MAVSTPLLGITVLVYLMIIFYLGWLGYKQTKAVDDFMVAGRKANPYVLALSYGATFISTSAIVGFGGAAGAMGMGLLWLAVMNVVVGIFIAFAIFGPRTRKLGKNLNAVTFPELLGRRQALSCSVFRQLETEPGTRLRAKDDLNSSSP